MKRDQFTFYRSYYDAVKQLPEKDKRSALELFLAVCAYALDGEEPQLTGVPLALFTLIRPTLDSGMKQAQRRKTTEEKTCADGITERNQTRRKAAPVPFSEQNRNRINSNSVAVTDSNKREKEREKEGEEESLRACAREDTAPTLDDDGLTQAIENNRRADQLIRRYRLPEGDTSLEALLEDEERVGWEAVEAALKRAAESNSRPMLSVTYYRAVLNGSKGGGDADERKPFCGYGAL